MTGHKGFFFARQDAVNFAKRWSNDSQVDYLVVETWCSEEMMSRGVKHDAAREGMGIYILDRDLRKLTAVTEVKS